MFSAHQQKGCVIELNLERPDYFDISPIEELQNQRKKYRLKKCSDHLDVFECIEIPNYIILRIFPF